MNKIIIIIFLDLADSIDMIFSTPFDGFLAKIGLDTCFWLKSICIVTNTFPLLLCCIEGVFCWLRVQLF